MHYFAEISKGFLKKKRKKRGIIKIVSCVALKYVFVLQHYWCFERREDYSCTNAHDCKLLNCVLITRWMVSLLFSPKVQHSKGILSFTSLAQSNLLPILKKTSHTLLVLTPYGGSSSKSSCKMKLANTFC